MSETSGRVYYVICSDDCLTEGMSKEQILAAIQQGLAQGYVSDPDAAVISKLRELNANGAVQVWAGTEAQFNALNPAPSVHSTVIRQGADGVLYLCTDDTTLSSILAQVEDIVSSKQDKIITKSIALNSSTWGDAMSVTIDVPGVTPSSTVIVGADSMLSWAQNWKKTGIYCAAQGDGTLTFSRAFDVSGATYAKVVIIN